MRVLKSIKITTVLYVLSACSTPYTKIAPLPPGSGIYKIDIKDGVCYTYGSDDFGNMVCEFNEPAKPPIPQVRLEEPTPNVPSKKATFGKSKSTGKVYTILDFK